MPLPINELNSEALAFLGFLKPASVAVGTATIGPFGCSLVNRVLFVLDVGVIAGGATVDAVVQTAPTIGGSYTNLAGTAITQVTVSAAGKIVLVECKGETISALGTGAFIQLLVTVGTAAVILAGNAIDAHADYSPGSDQNIASVVQTVVV